MKINRLLEITLILLNKGSTTASELADRFQVSTRTIYRDIDVLSTAGVPVFTNKGSKGGIFLLEEFALNRVVITGQERDSLLLAVQTLQSTEYPEIEAILDKIGGLFREKSVADWVSIQLSPWGSGPNVENKLLDLKKAILECKVISFDYINANGILIRRDMEPMQLVFRNQTWYLYGYCRMWRGMRSFRISRIKNLVVTNKQFTPRSDGALTPGLLEGIENGEPDAEYKKYVTLKLRFQPEDLYKVFDDYDEEEIVRNADGTYDVTVSFPEEEWVYGYIMSFGCYVEVLEPPNVREIIRERMEKALEFYQK